MSIRSSSVASRRAMLTGGLSALLLPLLPQRPVRADTVPPTILKANAASAKLLGADAPATAVWAYNGQVPGPVLRVRQGDEVAVRLQNSLDDPTTIHWHGIRIDNAMDGVPHLTQHAVEPGDVFDYRFRVPDAGTFWYHPHERSYEQVARGLFGILIVEEKEPPRTDQDLVIAINDWRLKADGALVEGFGSRHDRAHSGRLGNRITVNGTLDARIPVRLNERIRVRLLNCATARILRLRIEGLAAKIIAVDGQPVAPTTTYEEDSITLGPANRADVILDMIGTPGREIALVDISEDRQVLATFAYHASDVARPEPMIAPFALAANPVPEPGLADALKVDLLMTGGAADEKDMVMSSPLEAIWELNNASGMQKEPLFRVARGRSVAIRMVNSTAWPHAMHIHGHHARIVGRSGPRKLRPFFWDTVLMDPGEHATVAFSASNPGKWMLHCHMLDHQAAGMDTWFHVTD